MASLGDENICRFDVAVNDALCVSGIQSVRNLNRQAEQNIRLQRFSADTMLQRRAVQKLHGDECLAIVLINLMNRADVRMIQRGRRLRLALKAG